MPDAVVSQATPVSGTQYTVLDTTRNVRIHACVANVTWTVQPSPLEVHATIDGQTYTWSQANPVTATNYAIIQSVAGDGSAITGGLMALTYGVDTLFVNDLEGQSVKVLAEITGGTSDPLACRLKYSVLR